MQTLTKILLTVHKSALAVITLLILVKSIFHLSSGYDFLWYHLPRGLLAFNLTDFEPSPYTKTIIDSFPPLADWTIGFLVYSTGWMNTANTVNLLGAGIALFSIWRLHRDNKNINWVVFLTMIYGIPHFVLHLSTGYVDLFGAAGLLMAFSALVKIKYAGHLDPESLFWFLLGIGIACLSRFQALPVCAVLILVFTLVLFREKLASPRKIIGLFLVATLIAGIWPIRNTVKYGNPTYPYRPPFISKFIQFEVKRSTEREPSIQSPERLSHLPNFFLFLISAFEINRFLTNEGEDWKPGQTQYKWHHAQWADKGERNIHFRMGGWSIFTISILFWLFALLLFKYRRIDEISIGIIIIFILIGLLPHSNELRYFMAFPLMLSFYLVFSWGILSSRTRQIGSVLLFLSMCYTVVESKIYHIDFNDIEDLASQEIRDVWQKYEISGEGKVICVPNSVHNGILYTGPDLNSYPVVSRDYCHSVIVESSS